VVNVTDPYGRILEFLDRKTRSHCYKKMLWHIQFQMPVKNGIYITKFSLYVALSFHVWSSGQSSWLQSQRSLVRFPALPDFLRSSGSAKGSTQLRAYN
jgi:hypothetical protein